MKPNHARSNSLIHLLERTLRQSRQALHAEFKKNKLRISVDQWLILQQVSVSPGQNQQEIARLSAKDPASVTRILALMEKKKWVSRSVSKNDKRSIRVSVTAEGKRVLLQCTKGVEKFRLYAAKGISQDELNIQKIVLDKLFENCGGRV